MQAIVTETSARPALNRGDVIRLASVASSAISTAGSSPDEQDKVTESISRALSEVRQARTWNLMIDVIAQTGKYKPNARSLTDNFMVGEKQWWPRSAIKYFDFSAETAALPTKDETNTCAEAFRRWPVREAQSYFDVEAAKQHAH
jgi:hypothetical protein